MNHALLDTIQNSVQFALNAQKNAVGRRKQRMEFNEFKRGEVFRRITTCPMVNNGIDVYPRPWCIRYPMCEHGCCALCGKEDCTRKCIRVLMKK